MSGKGILSKKVVPRLVNIHDLQLIDLIIFTNTIRNIK
jgi:hypothetical protein